MPQVTVITPTYNGVQYIAETIESVLAQTMRDFEYIIVNDGSTDDTSEILAEFAKKDCRIRVVSLPKASGGPTIPKNLALSMVQSPYVCFLDHDDYFAPEKLTKMCIGMDENPHWVAAFHDVQLVDSAGAPHAGTYLSNSNFKAEANTYLSKKSNNWFECAADYYRFMSLRFAAIHTASVIVAPARLLNDPVSFRAQFKGSDDTDLWLRIGFQGPMGYLDEVQSYYRIHGANLSADVSTMTANGVEVHEANFTRVRKTLTASQVRQYRRKIHSYRSSLAHHLSVQRKFDQAMPIFKDIFRDGGYFEFVRGIAKLMIRMRFSK